MRIAVAALGIDPVKASLAPNLGMATHILILDHAGNVFDSIDREQDPRKAPLDFEAGLSLKKKEVDVLLTKHCEAYIEENLKESGIDVQFVEANTVGQALELFKLNDVVDGSVGAPDARGEPKIGEENQRENKKGTFLRKREAQHLVQAMEERARARQAKAAKINASVARVLDKYVKADGKLLGKYEQFSKHNQPVNMALLLALVEFLVPKVPFRDIVGDMLKDIEEIEKDAEKAEAQAGEATAKAEEAVAKAKRAQEKAKEAEASIQGTQ